MRPIRRTVAAAAVGAWIPLNKMSRDHAGIAVNPHDSVTGGTYTVNYTQSALNRKGPVCTFSRTTTVLTVTLPNHGLSITDEVSIQSRDYNGIFTPASIVDDDNFTVTVTDSGQASNKGHAQPIIISVLTGFDTVSGQVDGQIDATVEAVRLDCALSTGWPHDIIINQY